MKVKGVNIGNWLVLEKWMSPGLFAGTTAEDEYWLPRQLSKEVYEARIITHRDEYISERDFLIIKSWGMEAVRIPVPYFIFGDREPFIGCINHLDRAFNWAKKYGLKILIDLHTAPMGQNGSDNGGISGVCKWAQYPEEVEFELTVLERLAERYGKKQELWGIEILNEPALVDMWELSGMQERYKPMDAEMAKGSAGISIEFIRNFYMKAYERIRRHMPEEKYVVFHDGFNLMAWKDFMQEEKYRNVVLDTHLYLMMAEGMMGGELSVESYVKCIKEHFETGIEEMQKYHNVICGEWSLFNAYVCGTKANGGLTVLHGAEEAAEAGFSEDEKREIYNTLAKAQLAAWDKASGYFYWSYKLLTDTVNTKGWIGWDSWDIGRCIDYGWFPIESK